MRRLYPYLALVLVAAVLVWRGPERHLNRSKLDLTFAEEFDSHTLSIYDRLANPTGRWKTNFDHGWQEGASSRILKSEPQIYSDLQYNGVNPFALSHGTLLITADRIITPDRSKSENREFVSGLITTSKSFRQLYGYFEMQAVLPSGDGLWPAFWLLAGYNPAVAAPQYPGEIDVVELLGKDSDAIHCSAHWPTNPLATQKQSRTMTVRQRHSQQLKTYGVLWTASELIWYVDDVEVARMENPGLHRPMYILVNLAVGGNWAGPATSSTRFPASFQIEYIRAYRLIS